MENTLPERYLTAAARYYDALVAVDADAAHDVILAGFNAVRNRNHIPENLRGYLYAALQNRIRKIKQRYGIVENPPDVADGGEINPKDTLKTLLELLRRRFSVRDVEIYIDRVSGEPPRDIAKRLDVVPAQVYRVTNKIKAYIASSPICQELKKDIYR